MQSVWLVRAQSLQIFCTYTVLHCLITRRQQSGSKQVVTAVDTPVTQFVTKKIPNFTSAFVSEALQMVPEVTPIVAQAKNHEYTW